MKWFVRVLAVTVMGLAAPTAFGERTAGEKAKAEKALAKATTDDTGFEKVPTPGPADWLANHKEPGQTFEEYVRSKPLRPTKPRLAIVLQPLGGFSKEEKKVLAKAAEYAHIFFQLEVRTEGETALPMEKGMWRINKQTRREQYLTGYLMYKVLQPRVPKDAFAYMGVTMGDLYPAESWNYVFGEGSFKDRVGVYSFVRYTSGFWGEKATAETEALLVKRTCKIITHEAGHMFGLAHCVYYRCLMNGSNHLAEMDGQPMFLCPVCLKKLQWNIGFDVAKRYEEMGKFFATNGMKEEGEWVGKRMETLGLRP